MKHKKIHKQILSHTSIKSVYSNKYVRTDASIEWGKRLIAFFKNEKTQEETNEQKR